MTRANARELAVHLIYGREFTGEEPQKVVTTRLSKEYYATLSPENEVYSERPIKAQVNYLDHLLYSAYLFKNMNLIPETHTHTYSE